MKKNHLWVGIGASAGGLEALKELTSALDRKEAIYIVAQHLDPKHPTILKDLLERVSGLPIHLVEKDIKPKSGEIYIISPGHNAEIRNETICLKPAASVGPKPSVNEFFTSLAADAGERSIGIILSGTGSDGAQGIIAIKSAGGIAFCQDELSAKYSGMPRAAFETGVVDFVLTPSQIATELNSLIQTFSNGETRFSGPKLRSNLEKIFQRLYDQTNYDFSGYKLKTIQRRIQRRMVVNKMVTLDDYVTFLMASSSEVESLFKELLISVTAFFRDEEAFASLAESIKNLVKTSRTGETIRAWVPGCARGEEAYSIAILFYEAIAELNREAQFQIFATDIDDNALNKAREGLYTHDQIQGVPAELLNHYFNKVEDVYAIKKSLRENIVFARQNLIMDPPFSHLDLISCRNVMIYFNLETQKHIFNVFHFALKDNGCLFLGKSESAGSIACHLFDAVNSAAQLYRRKMVEVNIHSDRLGSARNLSYGHQAPSPGRTVKVRESQNIKEKMEQTILREFLPAAVVISSQGHIHHVRGDINPYLTIPEGTLDYNVLTMARDSLKVDIRSLMQRAKRDGKASAQALFFQHEIRNHLLFLSMKLLDDIENQDLFVLAFFDLTLDEGLHPQLVRTQLEQTSSEQMEREIEIFRERLQSSIQDLETTNEELQSTNEELQSANEELQSANEELQTANEELQSTNEELSTVNEELEIKTFELFKVNNDLESMLNSIDEVILFIDTRLRIQRFTHKAVRSFNLSREDIGQVLTSYDLAMDIPNLRIELLNVIEKEKESVIALRSRAIKCDLRLVAYKSDDKEVVGVILFFEKLTKECHENELMRQKMLQVLEQNSRYPFACVSNAGEFVFVSKAFPHQLGYDEKDLLDMHIGQLLTGHRYRSETELFDESSLSDQHGWRPITLMTRQEERLNGKYRFTRCANSNHSEFIVFFNFDDRGNN